MIQGRDGKESTDASDETSVADQNIAPSPRERTRPATPVNQVDVDRPTGARWEDHTKALHRMHDHLAGIPVPDLPMVHRAENVVLARDMVAAYCANQPRFQATPISDDLVETALSSRIPPLSDETLAIRLHDMRNTLDRIRATAPQPGESTDLLQEQSPKSFDDWVALGQAHHRALFRHPAHTHAGKFRNDYSGANGWAFATPRDLTRLLTLGFELAQSLPKGLAQAIMLHLTWVEAHPFFDGNGRTSRLLANAALSAAGQQTCTHTNRHRAEIAAAYHALRTLGNPHLVVGAWDRAQAWTADFQFTDFRSALVAIRKHGDLNSTWDIGEIIRNAGRTPEPTPLPDDEPL